MTEISIEGLAALQKRLALAAGQKAIQRTLLDEAEAIALEASAGAAGELGKSVEIKDASRGTRLAYAVGTPEPAGRYLEYGTVKRHATPWLTPVFRARLPRIKHALGRVVAGALKSPRGKV
jgi:hypothetical protein